MKKYGSVADALGCFSAFGGGCSGNEFPGHEEQVFQCIAANPGKPHQNGWVVYIVICYVIRVGVLCNHCISVINTDPEDKAIRLGRFIDCDTGQKLSADLQTRRSISGSVLNIRQFEAQFAYGVKVDHDAARYNEFRSRANIGLNVSHERPNPLLSKEGWLREVQQGWSVQSSAKRSL
jgi:hypothetical protein